MTQMVSTILCFGLVAGEGGVDVISGGRERGITFSDSEVTLPFDLRQ